MLERQITFGNYGHTLNHRQAISPDGLWAAYDTRNEDAHIAQTDAIEMVHIESCDIVRLYQTPSQSRYGPGVGAVAFHPREPRVVFIHGLENNSSANKYSAARRFGAIVDFAKPNTLIHAEARVHSDHPTGRVLGALSGGTHAHSWNEDGWLSFTYNDAWLERQSQLDNTVRDVRTVGFMVPDMPISIECQLGIPLGEEFSGTYAAFLAPTLNRLTSSHRRDSSNAVDGWGNDEIEYAVEECWLKKQHSLAFLGGIRDERGILVNEIYVCKLPSKLELVAMMSRPNPGSPPEDILEPVGNCEQRRLTKTTNRRYPGVQGPRNWLVSSPNGEVVYAPMKDDRGVVQLFGIDATTGDIKQITDLEFPIEGQISLDSSGSTCSFVCQQRIGLTTVSTGATRWLNNASPNRIVGAVHFVSPTRLLFNRRVGTEREGWLQVFVVDMD